MDEKKKLVATKVTYDNNELLVGFARYDDQGNNIANTYAKAKNTQEPLKSGYNIKTINGQSILGSGNIQIAGDGGVVSYPVTDIYVNGESVMDGTVANIVIPESSGGTAPTKLSELVNDVGYITNEQMEEGTIIGYEIVTNQDLSDLGIDPEDLL